MTLVNVKLDSGATLEQDLPDSYNGFVYVMEGAVRVGDDDIIISGRMESC